MVKQKSIGLVALISVIMLSASFATVLGTINTPEEKSVARTEAAVDFTVIGPTFTSNKYTGIVSAGGKFSYSVALSSASPYSASQLNIQWMLDTDWDTSVNVTGATLTWIYFNESANRDITVTVTEKTNSTNTTTEHVTVQVIADLDKDGLPDVWERQYFNSITATGGTDDSDKDGWTDLEEHQKGTDPTVSNPKPGFLETYSWLVALLAIIVVVTVLLIFIVMPKMKTEREADEKKKIAAAVEVEKSLLGLDELEDTPKK